MDEWKEDMNNLLNEFQENTGKLNEIRITIREMNIEFSKEKW